jgi:hypothetical protein
MVGDPDELRTVAARLRREADQVRSVSLRVGAARRVEWHSVAAEAFRERVSEAVHGERRAAELLDEAASAVDAHAAAVQCVLEELARVARTAQEAVGRLGD